MRHHRRYRPSLGQAAIASIVILAAACSFAWEDYEPSGGSTEASSSSAGAASTSSGTAGSGGGPCGAGKKLCAEACVADDDPALGCAGTSCDPCPSANGAAICTDGACAIDCGPDLADCDADHTTCETPIKTSPQHCGGCNMPCSGTCVDGNCILENCTNGTDDDGDGMPDCADPDCSTFACITVPSGWSGPVALYDGDFNGLPPDCSGVPGTQEFSGIGGIVADPPMCTQCSCGAAAVNCALQPLAFFSDTACAVAAGSAPQPSSGCFTGPASPAGLAAAAPTASASCPPSGGMPNNDPPMFTMGSLACAPSVTGAGCAPPAVCVGGYPAPFGAKSCVFKNGPHACPPGFDDQHILADDANDNRDCTACTCSTPGGASCMAITNGYTGATCSGGPVIAVPNTGTCINAAGSAPGSYDVTVIGDVSGGCTESGGDPVGSVDPTGETTFCCQP